MNAVKQYQEEDNLEIFMDGDKNCLNIHQSASMAELDKFKRRLIRSVARLLLVEQKSPDEVWETLKKETGRDCDEIWKRMRALTLKKLNRLLANDDYIARIGKIARMTHTDWLMFDLVLVYEEVDVITVEGAKPSQQTCLQDLLDLVREFQVDLCPVVDLAAQWRDLTLQYNLNGRQISPMLLQLRWHQLKQSTRDTFYSFWFSFRGNLINLTRHKPQRPSRLQTNVANSFYDIITQPFPSWRETVEMRRVVPQEEFARLHRSESFANRPDTSENEPDLVMIEPKIDTITLDSDEESTLEDSADNVEDKLKDNEFNDPQANDPHHNPETAVVESLDSNEKNDITNIQEHLGITIKDEPIPVASLDDLIEVIDQRTHKEEDGLSNVKILTAIHVPTEDIDPPSDKSLTKEIVTDTTDTTINALPKNSAIIGYVAFDQTQEIDLSMEDDLIKIVENDIALKIDQERGMLRAVLETEDTMDSKNEHDNDFDDDDDRDIFFYTNLDDDISKPESKQLAEVEDAYTKMGESSVIGELPTSYEVIDDGIEFEDEYDDDNYCKEEVVAGIKQETETSTNTTNECGDDLKTEDRSLEETTPKFDLKLIMQPVVYTTRLDDMTLFIKENENCKYVTTESTIAQILAESKPISSKSIHPKPKIPHVDETDVVPLIKEEKLSSEDQIKLAPSTSEGEPNSSDDEDIERVNPSCSLFQKPKSLSYNPIQFCKNPDFNTTLKRLPVGFFFLESNRQYLKTLKPVTVDLHKSFEKKLINNTVYLKPSPLSDTVRSQEDNANNVSVVVAASAMLAQSLVDAMLPSKHTEDDDVPSCSLTNAAISDEEALLAERKNKVISLPDITKIRRINQHLQTAEVSPIQQSKEDTKLEVFLKEKISDAQEIKKDIKEDFKHVIENIEPKSKVVLPELNEINDDSLQENLQENEKEVIPLISKEKQQAVEVEAKPDPELIAAIEQLTQPSIVADINVSASEAQPICETLFNHYLNVNNTSIPERTIDTIERTREVRNEAQITNKAKKKTPRTQPIPWYLRDIRPNAWKWEFKKTDTFGTITNDTLFKMLKFLGGNEDIFLAHYDKHATEKMRKEMTSLSEKKSTKMPKVRKTKPKGRPRKMYCCWARKRVLTRKEYSHDCFGFTNKCTCCCKQLYNREFNEDLDKCKIPDGDDFELDKSNHSDKIDQPDRTDKPDQGDRTNEDSEPNKNDGPDIVTAKDNSEINSAVHEIRQTLKLAKPKTPKPAVRVVAVGNIFKKSANYTHKCTSQPIANLHRETRRTLAAVPTIDIATESATAESAAETTTDNLDAIHDIPAVDIEMDFASNSVEPTAADGSINIASVDISTHTVSVDLSIDCASIDVTGYIPVDNTILSTGNVTSESAPETSIAPVTSLNTSNASELIVLSDDENNPAPFSGEIIAVSQNEEVISSTSASQPPEPLQLILPHPLSQSSYMEQTSTNPSVSYTEKKGLRKVWKTKSIIKCSAKTITQCPIDIGEGYVLLTSAKIPPDLLEPAPKPAPAVALTDFVLPPGVEIMVTENGDLVCNLQPGLQLDAQQLNEIYSVVASVQQQLQSSAFPIVPPPLDAFENTVVLSDDDVTQTDCAALDETNSSIINSDSTNVNVASVTSRSDYESDLHKKESPTEGHSEVSEINERTHLDQNEDGEHETSIVAEYLDVRKQVDASNAAPEKGTEVNIDTNKRINQLGDISKATHIIAEVDASENSRKKQNENSPEIENSSEAEFTDPTVTDVEAEKESTVVDKSENTIETKADAEVSQKKTGVEGKGDLNKKSILSDLMAMSGISSEDFQAPVEPIIVHTDKHVDLLSPVTSMNILRYAYDQKAKFFKYNIATKKLAQIRMTIEKVLKGKNNVSGKPQAVIDLTDTPVKAPGVRLAIKPSPSITTVKTKRTYNRRKLNVPVTKTRKRKQMYDAVPKQLNESEYPRLEIDGTVFEITEENYRAKSKPPIIIRNVDNSKSLLRQDLPVEPLRKRPRKEKIEAKIYLDSDTPMEEEYLYDSSSDEEAQAALEQRYSMLLAQASLLESSTDDDVDSDDEPLAKKVTRRKREEERKSEKLVTIVGGADIDIPLLCLPTEYLDLHGTSDSGEDDNFILGA